jgi:hypothetical protein
MATVTRLAELETLAECGGVAVITAAAVRRLAECITSETVGVQALRALIHHEWTMGRIAVRVVRGELVVQTRAEFYAIGPEEDDLLRDPLSRCALCAAGLVLTC